jgi:hypothetical protein
MIKTLKVIGKHFVVVLALVVTEWALKGALHYAVQWGYMPQEVADVASSILSSFMVMSILVFCVSGLVIFIKSAFKGDDDE